MVSQRFGEGLNPLESQPQAPVGGRRQQQAAARDEHAPHLREPARRVSHVLDHLAGPDELEGVVLEGQRTFEGDEAEVKPRMPSLGAGYRGLGHLGADRLRPGLGQGGREPALSRSQIEHPLARPGLAEQEGATQFLVRRRQIWRQPLPELLVVVTHAATVPSGRRSYAQAVEVCAVIVTRDRRAMLAGALAALRAQTRSPDRILVVDNASTDGTLAMLHRDHPDVDVVSLPSNQGGAGGFHEGLRAARSADWVWVMDDDTAPAPSCLEALLRAADLVPGPPALLSSKVVWTDGRLHPMNTPQLERERTEAMIGAGEIGLVPLRAATFVSLLIRGSAIEAHGLPLRDYFLWSDDIEYTARILRSEPGYLVPTSVAVHRTERPYTAVSAAGERFYFHVRNTLYMLRGPAWARHEKPNLVFGLLASIAAYVRVNRFAPGALAVIARGLRDGLRWRIPRAGE